LQILVQGSQSRSDAQPYILIASISSPVPVVISVSHFFSPHTCSAMHCHGHGSFGVFPRDCGWFIQIKHKPQRHPPHTVPVPCQVTKNFCAPWMARLKWEERRLQPFPRPPSRKEEKNASFRRKPTFFLPMRSSQPYTRLVFSALSPSSSAGRTAMRR
jgi:hypothetical protein